MSLSAVDQVSWPADSDLRRERHRVRIAPARAVRQDGAPQMVMVAHPAESPAPDMDSETAALVCAARAGDANACRQIWVRYAGMVQRMVQRFFGPGPDHSDICQEVFLRVFKRMGEIRTPAALQGFVASVTLGVSRNEARRRRIRGIVGLVPHEELPETRASTDNSEAREAARALYCMLDRLSAEERSLFVARFIEKMELSEVAAAHDMSLSTVKRRMAHLVSHVNSLIQSDRVLSDYVGRLD